MRELECTERKEPTDHIKISVAIIAAELYAVEQRKTREQVLFDAGFYPEDLKLWKKGKGADRAEMFMDEIQFKIDTNLRAYLYTFAYKN